MASSAELAAALGTHAVVIRRLLGSLRSSGIVESRSGRGGGWAIARDPARVRLSDISDALAAGVDQRSAPQTALDRALDSADAAYLARLSEFSLADISRDT
jgi:DNA-binding IscR family transcriptional regulator